MSLFSSLQAATSRLRAPPGAGGAASPAGLNGADRVNRDQLLALQQSGILVDGLTRRAMADALRVRANDLSARHQRYRTHLRYLSGILSLLRDESKSDDGRWLPGFVEDLGQSLTALSGNPNDGEAAARAVVAADTFAREVVRISQGVDRLSRDMDNEIGHSMGDIQRLLDAIDLVNGGGDSASEREDAIQQLNAQVGVRTMTRPDGHVVVYTASGFTLLDRQPAMLTLRNGEILCGFGQSATVVNRYFRSGHLGALLEMRATDGVDGEAEGAVRVVHNLRAQFDALAGAFLSGTGANEPTSFASAYTTGKPVDPKRGFFIGRNRLSFAVHPELITDPTRLRSRPIPAIAKAVRESGRRFVAGGLTLSGTSYAGMAAAISDNIQTMVNDVKRSLEFTQAFRDLLVERNRSPADVVFAGEVARLQHLQASLSHSTRARILTETMANVLEGAVQ